MELNELHVFKRHAGAVGQCHPVACIDDGVGAREEHTPTSTGSKDDSLRGDRMKATMQKVPGYDAATGSVFHDQCGGVPLVVDLDASLEELLVHGVKDRVAGTIGCITRSREARSAERALRDPAPVIPAKDHPHPFQFEYVGRRLLTHRFNGVLIAKIEPPLGGVERVRLPGIIVAQCRVDSTLGSNGVTSDGMDFGENGDVEMAPV